MGQLKLEVNEEKMRICRVSEEMFDFLGYSFEPVATVPVRNE